MPHYLPPAVILAGGKSARMGGGDKALLELKGRPLLAHVVARLGPQAGALALNANGDPARFAPFGMQVLPDPMPGQPGPLAGILAAMHWAMALDKPDVVTVTCDLPFLPQDLVARLGPGPVFARSAGRDHPTVGRWPTALAPVLADWITAGNRRVMDWVATTGARAVDFDDTPDPFFNVNTPEDLVRAALY